MTGWLAIIGVLLVLLASTYTGLTGADSSTSAAPEVTPVTDLQDVDTPTPAPSPSPTTIRPTPTPTQVLNRQDCDEIRGTDYHSPEERAWYLENCVRR